MATIPMGSGRRVMPGRAAMPQASGLEYGVASARALENLGQAGTQIASGMIAQKTSLDMQEAQRQEQLAEAAQRQKDMLQLQQTEDKLRDAHDEFTNGIAQGTIPKDQAETLWTEKSSGIVSEAMPGFRQQSQDLVRRSLEVQGMRLGNGVRKAKEGKDRQDVTAGISQTLEYLQRQYKTDPAKAQTQAMQTLEQLGPFSNYSPEQLAKLGQSWKESTQYTTGFEAISAGKTDRKALQAAEQVVNGLPDLDPQKKAQLLDRAQSFRLHLDQQDELRAQRVQREQERRMNNAQAEFQTFQALADKGTVLDPAYIDRVSQATAGTPYQSGVIALAKQAKETGGLAAQPLNVQRQLLTEVDSLIAKKGRTPELDKRREQLQKVVTGSEQDMQRDPLRAGLERGVITSLPPLNLQGGVQGLVQQLGERVVQADRVKTWAGRPVSPLTAEESQSLGQMLKGLPVEQRASGIAMIAATMPPQQTQALAAQIDAQDRPLAIALALGASRTTFDRPTSELVLKGAQALKDKTIKEEKTPVDGWKARINAATSAVFLNPQQAEMTSEAARYILAGKVAEGASGSESDVKAAIRLAVGGTLEDRNGSRIVLPAGVERQAFDKRLKAYPAQELATQLPDGKVYVRGQPMELAQFLTSLPDAQLSTVGRGRYVVKAGGSLAANANAQPIVIEVPHAR